MRNIFLLLALSFTLGVYSQITTNVGTFHSVAVYDKITVTLIQASEPKVELSGTNSDQVELINKNGSLKIKMNLKNTLQGDHVKAKVYYTSIDEIIADEGSVVKADQTIENNHLDITVRKGGIFKATIQTDRLTIKGNTGGISQINGQAKFQSIVSNAGAEINHKDLKTQQTEVTTNAGGIAQVTATDLVDAKTRAGGTIKVYGEPKELREKNIAGGTISIVK